MLRLIILLALPASTAACIQTKHPEPGIPATTASPKPACIRCAKNLITVDPPNPAVLGVKMMDSDSPGMTADGCSTRTFACMGTLPVIEINGGKSMASGSTKATAMVTCNAAGTAWERNGAPVARVSCNIPCQRCVAADVAISSVAPGTVPTTAATIDRIGNCATWAIQCTGPSQQKWLLNGGINYGDADDGTPDGIATLDVTCDKTGKFWNYGSKLTTMVCSAV